MIAIPNMKLPRTCYECDSDFASSFGCEEWWGWVFKEYKEKRSPDCPLIDIVTCGECKWYNPWHANYTNIDGNYCRFIDRPMKPTDFCSYGERRTETLDERIKRGLKEWKEK